MTRRPARRGALARHRADPGVPRPQRRGRRLGGPRRHRRRGRGRRRRRPRLRRLARERRPSPASRCARDARPAPTARAASSAPPPPWARRSAPPTARSSCSRPTGPCSAAPARPARGGPPPTSATTSSSPPATSRTPSSPSVPAAERGAYEFISARDGDGHGSHTASTAAGNDGVPMSVAGNDLGEGSGMAPGAKLAVYKVCWEDDDPRHRRLLHGRLHQGDRAGRRRRRRRHQLLDLRRDHHGRRRGRVRVLQRGQRRRVRRGLGRQLRPRRLDRRAQQPVGDHGRRDDVQARRGHRRARQRREAPRARRSPGPPSRRRRRCCPRSAVLAGATAEAARLCTPGTLDPAVVTGKVVVCDRGVVDRVAKSAAVAQAGGVGHDPDQHHAGQPRPRLPRGAHGPRRRGRRCRRSRPT